MSGAMAQRYTKAMIAGNADTCIAIEQERGLFGYPPELVSVGLHGLDKGMDPHDAINEYINSCKYENERIP